MIKNKRPPGGNNKSGAAAKSSGPETQTQEDKMHYIGLDVHKKTIAYCAKTVDGTIVDEGTIQALRPDLEAWAAARPAAWKGTLEATMFSGWIYDTLKPHADDLAVAHPASLVAITRAKKKSDKLDSRKLSDLTRINMVPRVWMPPRQQRELRRLLRFRNRLVQQAVWNKNRIATLLMELGEPYTKSKLHSKKYFEPLVDQLEACETDLLLLGVSRDRVEATLAIVRQIENRLLSHASLVKRVELLRTIPGVGAITALTWALEIGDVKRFGKIDQAISYCGLCSRLDESAGKSRRGPLSKQRNGHLQHVLIEAAKVAPRWNEELARLHTREVERGHRNRATLAPARQLVTLLLAVERRGTAYERRE